MTQMPFGCGVFSCFAGCMCVIYSINTPICAIIPNFASESTINRAIDLRDRKVRTAQSNAPVKSRAFLVLTRRDRQGHRKLLPSPAEAPEGSEGGLTPRSPRFSRSLGEHSSVDSLTGCAESLVFPVKGSQRTRFAYAPFGSFGERGRVKMKTWGKSPRQRQVIVAAGKPCMLKCHVYSGLSYDKVSCSLTTAMCRGG